ncbi:small integral membrane protein 43 isoform X6 [Tursiops truncatus]|uniref:small integral membrane protein 43 isoform X6 n=1 Tax=Tursiops truncatus TaxID=9739 RepID=UPI003CCF006A
MAHGPSRSAACGIFPARIRVPCIGRRTLNHCATSILQGYTGSFEALTFKVSKEGAEMHVSRRCFFLGLCRLKFWSRAAALGWGVEDRGCSYSRVTGLETPEMDVFCDAVPQVSRGLNHP